MPERRLEGGEAQGKLQKDVPPLGQYREEPMPVPACMQLVFRVPVMPIRAEIGIDEQYQGGPAAEAQWSLQRGPFPVFEPKPVNPFQKLNPEAKLCEP